MYEEKLTFGEAFRCNIIKEGDRVNITALYPQDEIVTIYPSQTGWHEKQYFSKEKDLEFFFAKDRDGSPTFWGSTTQTKLILCGEKGAKYGESVINEICSMYSNLDLGMISRAITEEDIQENLFFKRDVYSKVKTMKSTWVASKCISVCHESVSFGIHYLNKGHILYNYLYDCTEGLCKSEKYGVAPAVSVCQESNIIVKKENEEWILLPK